MLALCAAALCPITAQAGTGPEATIGYAKSYYWGLGSTNGYFRFELTGTVVVAGRLYVGQIVGVAHDTTKFPDRVEIAPFSLTGATPASSISLTCSGTVYDYEQFKLDCDGSVAGGPVGPRTVRFRGAHFSRSTSGPLQGTIYSIYRGIA